MSDQELLSKIIEVVDDEDNPITEDLICENSFITDPRNKEFVPLFEASSFYENKWEWHQLARFVFKQQNAPQYMYDKLWSLLLKHRGTYQNYFEIDTEVGTFPIPDALTDLNKLETLYVQFFEIFQDIINKIHFDYPTKEYYGPSYKGNIDWEKTIQKSKTEFPIQFQSSVPFRKFDTPENILLVLCARWLHKECERIIQLDFAEPLDITKKQILEIISSRTKNMILNFPFQDVVKSTLPLWDVDYNDKLIYNIENKIREKITTRSIRNKNYSKLLTWIEEFRTLNLMMVTEQIPTPNLLKSKAAQDTIFEAWIFFELFDYFYESGYDPILYLDSKPYFFEFTYEQNHIKIFYEKHFHPKDDYVWALQHKPDFTVMVNDKIIGIFDAKNFSKGQDPSPAINKILSYMGNFNTKFGVLFFPFLPKFWDEWGRRRRQKALLPLYAKKNPEKNETQLLAISKPEIDKTWEKLPPQAKQEITLSSIQMIPNPQDVETSLYLMRVEPNNSELAIQLKNQTIKYVCQEIFKKII